MKRDKLRFGEYFDLELEKKGYVVFNKVTGELEKVDFDRFLDTVTGRNSNGGVIVRRLR